MDVVAFKQEVNKGIFSEKSSVLALKGDGNKNVNTYFLVPFCFVYFYSFSLPV